MSTPLLPVIFNRLLGTPCQFGKINGKILDTHLKNLETLSIFPDVIKDHFVYPINGDRDVYIRLSTINKLRHSCIERLDTLPEKQERIIREFLIDTENTCPVRARQASQKSTYLLHATTPKPL